MANTTDATNDRIVQMRLYGRSAPSIANTLKAPGARVRATGGER